MRRHPWIALLSSVTLFACGDTGSAPAGGASPQAHSPAPFSSPAAGMPPGHPPIGDGGGGASAGGHPEAPDPTAPVDPKQAISGTIDVSAELKPKAAGAQALFVIARSGGQIVAVQKVDSATLPATFQISGANAMGAGGPAFAGPLDVTARLSKSGDAAAAPGDLEGVAKAVTVGATGVKIVLDSVRQ